MARRPTQLAQLDYDPVHRGSRVFVEHDEADELVLVRHRRVEPHFTRFVQVSLEPAFGELLTLPLAELRVLLALVSSADRQGNAALTTVKLAEVTCFKPHVVSRTLTKLWTRDLIRRTGRTAEGRTWAVTPRLFYRAPAGMASALLVRYNHLPMPA